MRVQVERRSRKRFPLHLPIRFSASGPGMLRVLGTGTVIDISSKGLSFRSPEAPLPGLSVTASLNWPAVLDGGCRLQLTVAGEVIRQERDVAVMSIERYEFRTSGRVSALTHDEVESVARQFGDSIAAGLHM